MRNSWEKLRKLEDQYSITWKQYSKMKQREKERCKIPKKLFKKMSQNSRTCFLDAKKPPGVRCHLYQSISHWNTGKLRSDKERVLKASREKEGRGHMKTIRNQKGSRYLNSGTGSQEKIESNTFKALKEIVSKI